MTCDACDASMRSRRCMPLPCDAMCNPGVLNVHTMCRPCASHACNVCVCHVHEYAMCIILGVPCEYHVYDMPCVFPVCAMCIPRNIQCVLCASMLMPCVPTVMCLPWALHVYSMYNALCMPCRCHVYDICNVRKCVQ